MFLPVTQLALAHTPKYCWVCEFSSVFQVKLCHVVPHETWLLRRFRAGQGRARGWLLGLQAGNGCVSLVAVELVWLCPSQVPNSCPHPACWVSLVYWIHSLIHSASHWTSTMRHALFHWTKQMKVLLWGDQAFQRRETLNKEHTQLCQLMVSTRKTGNNAREDGEGRGCW